MANGSKSSTRILIGVAAVILIVAAAFWWRSGDRTPGGAEQRLVVAFLGPLSGDAASFGISQRNGVDLALEEVNSAGGVWGQPVQVVYEDTQLDQNRAIAALNKVIDSDGASVVLGDTSSSNTMAIGPLAQRRGVLLISPIASAANVTRSGFPIFRISPSDTFQARIAARVALDSGWTSAAVLYTNDEWGGGLAREFADYYRQNGGTLSESVGVEPRSQDFRPQLTRIRGSNPAVVYIPLHPDEAAVALRQARQLGLRSQFLGADSFSEPTIVAAAGGAAEGVIYTVPAPGEGAVFEEFSRRYQARYGEAPSYNAAAGYDALKLVADAARRAERRDLEAMKAAVAGTAAFEGASGKISFDSAGDVTSKAFDVRRIGNGTSEVVKRQVALPSS